MATETANNSPGIPYNRNRTSPRHRRAVTGRLVAVVAVDTVPMTTEEQAEAVTALAALLAVHPDSPSNHHRPG